MKSQITITNIKNIDFSTMRVIDESLVETSIYDSDMDVFIFEDIHSQSRRSANLMSVSLYDDLIVKGDEKFKILGMLTKNEFE